MLSKPPTSAHPIHTWCPKRRERLPKGKQIKRQNTWRDFQVIRRKAGVPNCSLHDLRKSYCTNLAGSIPMHVVQELAGHSDIRTTRQYYVKVRPELLEKARRAVDTLVMK